LRVLVLGCACSPVFKVIIIPLSAKVPVINWQLQGTSVKYNVTSPSGYGNTCTTNGRTLQNLEADLTTISSKEIEIHEGWIIVSQVW
jgi:hypothetical protein